MLTIATQVLSSPFHFCTTHCQPSAAKAVIALSAILVQGIPFASQVLEAFSLDFVFGDTRSVSLYVLCFSMKPSARNTVYPNGMGGYYVESHDRNEMLNFGLSWQHDTCRVCLQ